MFQNSQFQLFRHLQSRYGHGCVPVMLADGTMALLVAGNNFSPPDLAEVGSWGGHLGDWWWWQSIEVEMVILVMIMMFVMAMIMELD